MAGPILSVDRISTAYGDIPVLWDVSFAVAANELVALVGSNGAGKTTLLKTISGLLHPLKGEIRFNDDSVARLSPDEILRRGISYVPEGRALFHGLTVADNLLMGAYLQRDKSTVRNRLDFVCEMFPILKERSSQLAGTLSGGQQQMCAIARALMSSPQLLMVDELSLGLGPTIVERLARGLLELKERGLSIILVEQNVEMALQLADRAYIIEGGKVVNEGRARQLIDIPNIRDLYFGVHFEY